MIKLNVMSVCLCNVQVTVVFYIVNYFKIFETCQLEQLYLDSFNISVKNINFMCIKDWCLMKL